MAEQRDEINLSASGVSLEEDGGAGCAVVLHYKDTHGRILIRKMSYPLGIADLLWANLQAVRLALASVTRPLRKSARLTLIVDNNVVGPLSGDDVDEHIELLREIRKLLSLFSNLKIVGLNATDLAPYEDARHCAETQVATDSGTK